MKKNMGPSMARAKIQRFGIQSGLIFSIVLGLSACEEGAKMPNFLQKNAESGNNNARSTKTKLVERDVEAPDVFQVTEPGLWDGRPSLGGVWVAHPTVTDPERVIVRNEANGKFVIGALFRRERDNPGPTLQVSSDAAEALGLTAGKPANLNVTALRREEVVPKVEEINPETQVLAAPAGVEETTLDPVATASAALARIDGDLAPEAPSAAKPVAAAAVPKPKEQKSIFLSKPYVQIGFYSVEANAKKTGELLRKAGMVPTVKKQTSNGKTFWRVIVGPAATAIERGILLKSIKALGYSDAYSVKG
ncbi:MAG: SPOR domain-containing protein [Paracoccaceae bacterium]|nr:SPOR domain-containing protein [Paracoccaceae bacterium]